MESKFKIGDRIKQRYIYDCCVYNNMPATILEQRKYKYYPNGDYSVIETRIQTLIKYDNGREVYVDIEAYEDNSPHRLSSPFELVV